MTAPAGRAEARRPFIFPPDNSAGSTYDSRLRVRNERRGDG